MAGMTAAKRKAGDEDVRAAQAARSKDAAAESEAESASEDDSDSESDSESDSGSESDDSDDDSHPADTVVTRTSRTSAATIAAGATDSERSVADRDDNGFSLSDDDLSDDDSGLSSVYSDSDSYDSDDARAFGARYFRERDREVRISNKPQLLGMKVAGYEDESDDEFAFMRVSDPYPPMDRQNKARCIRFIKKKSTDLKRVFMKKVVKKQRKIRDRFRTEGRDAALLMEDEEFRALHDEFKLLEKMNIEVLCELAWQYYWDKNNKIKFPADVPLTETHKLYIKRALTHEVMQQAFNQLIKAHLHKLKRQARKIIKAVNREKRKADKVNKLQAVEQLTELLGEGAKRASTRKFDVDQLRIGQVCDCIVDRVESFGMFVTFWRAREEIRGLIHVSQLSDKYTKDPSQHFHMGDKLTAVIIKVDRVEHKVDLSLKQSYFPEGQQPAVEHLGEKVRATIIEERNKLRKINGTLLDGEENGGELTGLSSLFLDKLQSKMNLDESALQKIKQFYALAANAKNVKNRLGQKQRRRLAEEVLGWQRRLAKHERPLTKKQLKKQARKEEVNRRHGILPLTPEQRAAKEAEDRAEKKARALRKYDKNKERNKLRRQEQLQNEKKRKTAPSQPSSGGDGGSRPVRRTRVA